VSAPTNRWKLGAFVVGTVVLGLTAAAVLASRALQVETVTYTSYFDEAVTGLEVGSPISYRGVRLGSISRIDIAPDRRHVELTYTLGVSALERLGLSGRPGAEKTTLAVPPGLRVQIASNGLTGNRYLEIDFFDAKVGPPKRLPFPVPVNYIPATPSTMKSVEAAMVRAMDGLPVLVDQLGAAAVQARVLLDEVGERKLPARVVATLDGADRLVAAVHGKVADVPVAELSREALGALSRLERVLDQLEGRAGLLASVQRTSEALAEVAGPELGGNLDQTGRDLREAAVAVRQLVEALQRDPDMLLKGKTPVAR